VCRGLAGWQSGTGASRSRWNVPTESWMAPALDLLTRIHGLALAAVGAGRDPGGDGDRERVRLAELYADQ